MASYHKLGIKSEERMVHLMDPMAAVVRRALVICPIDFSVIETIRSEQQQQVNIQKKVSWTMDSKHLDADKDGKVAAVDIFPYVNGKTSHDPDHYKLVARAMFQAAMELGVQIRWGGFWRGGDPFRDGPHFELA